MAETTLHPDALAVLARIEPMIIAIHAQLPYLATKADLAQEVGRLDTEIAEMRGAMPSRTYFLGMIGLLLAGQAVIVGAVALTRFFGG